MELVNKIQADVDAVARLEAAETPEEIYAAIKKYLTGGFEQFRTALVDTLQCAMKAARAARKDLEADRELEPDELDMVTGGGWFSNAWNWVRGHSKQVLEGIVGAVMVAGIAAIVVAATVLTAGTAAMVGGLGAIAVFVGTGVEVPLLMSKS